MCLHINLATSTSKMGLYPKHQGHGYLPEGTAMIVMNAWSLRVRGAGEDPKGLGQWNFVTFGGCQEKQLTIITAY